MLTVVLAAPGPITRHVQGVLRDWSAVGLLERYAWVGAETARAAARPLQAAAELVDNGSVTTRALNDHLTDHQSDSGFRLCILTELGDDRRAGISAVANELRNSLKQASVPVATIHLVSALATDVGLADDDLWLGWNNVLISPEDSADPAPGKLARVLTSPDDAYIRHVAANVAALTGLWQSMGVGPLDDRDAGGSRQIAVARSFLRTVDAREVESDVREALIDMSRGLPRPVQSGRTHGYFDNPAGAATEMADTVIAQHPQLFSTTTSPRQARSTDNIGGLRLLKMFFSFVWASLRAAPRRWVSHVVDSASSRAARQISALVFAGQESRYEVVVNGLTATGQRADTPQLRQALEQWETGEGARRRSLPPLPPTSQFWEAVATGALTLLDGDEHSSGLKAPLSGGQPAVMRTPSDIAPAAGRGHLLAPDAAIALGVSQIDAADLLAGRWALQTLDEAMAADPSQASRLRGSRDALHHDMTTVEQTYVGAIGTHLANQVMASEHRVKTLAERLSRFQRERGDSAALDKAARGIARGIQVSTVLLLIVIVVMSIAGAMNWLAWSVVGLVCAGVVAIWALITGLVVWNRMFSRFREEFARLHQRENDEDEARALTADFQSALFERRRDLTQYTQYLAWAQVIGSFVHAPLGRMSQAGERTMRLGGELPRSVGLGRAKADPVAIDQAVKALRVKLFQPGWSRQLWNERVKQAIVDLNQAGLVVDRRDALFGADPVLEESPLRGWALTARNDPDAVGSDALVWQDARKTIFSGRPGEHHSDFITRVVTIGHSEMAQVSGDTFIAELVSAATAPRTFTPDVFSRSGKVGGRSHVSRTFVYVDRPTPEVSNDGSHDIATIETTRARDTANGLDRFTVVIQLSAEMGRMDLASDAGVLAPVPDVRPDPDPHVPVPPVFNPIDHL